MKSTKAPGPLVLGSSAGLGVLAVKLPRAPNRRAPTKHEWIQCAPGLWGCPWCRGFVESETRPDPEHRTMPNARMEELGLLGA